jgi:hypothetical protein
MLRESQHERNFLAHFRTLPFVLSLLNFVRRLFLS